MEALNFLKHQVDKNEERIDKLSDSINELSRVVAAFMATQTSMGATLTDMSSTLKEMKNQLQSHQQTIAISQSAFKWFITTGAGLISLCATGAMYIYQIFFSRH